MKNTKFEVTQQELSLLISLISDQLFRREFIDPKMPGYKGNPSDVAMGKELLGRLKSVRQADDSPNELVTKRQTNHAG